MASLIDVMEERYANRPDKDNIFGVGVSDAEFRKFIIDYLLGNDWYVVDPLGKNQINEIALYQILEKYSKQYRKELSARDSFKARIKDYIIKIVSKWWYKKRAAFNGNSFFNLL